jgi:hypothetical protein
MPRNEDLDAGLAELNAAGVRDVVVARGSKHIQLRWKARGQPRMKSIAVSPSDWRSRRNVRAEIRGLLRADGLLPEPTRKPPKAQLHWREQVEDLSRRLRQITVPAETVTERDEILAHLHRLTMNPDVPAQAKNR